MNESLVFNFDSETAIKAVMTTLARRGLYVIRSFDLQSALGAHGGCECPHHGTAQCNCQFVVLLVYGEAAEPVVITTHSRDNRTEARIVHDAATIPDPRLAGEVMAALVEAAIMLPMASSTVERNSYDQHC
ncbi:MAG: hypothetical protein HYZ49_12880 [Chloroflexi bacterium]|nr:hypothetical protein [Chloroflexota bacterium]